MIFNKTTIVLVRPQLPENIGMVARTMDNFGFKNLTLVLPRERWPNKKSLQASKHAKKIIENTKLYFNLEVEPDVAPYADFMEKMINPSKCDV